MIGKLFGGLLGAFSGKKAPARSREGEVSALWEKLDRSRQAGTLEDHAGVLRELLALGVGGADLQGELGLVNLRLERLEAARAAFQAARSLDPSFPNGPKAQFYAALAAARIKGPAAAPPDGPGMVRAAAPLVSVIICSREPAKFDAVTANYRKRLGSVSHELIGVHDARSLCEGYNRGIARSRGGIVVFSHDDIEIVSADFAAKLIDGLERCDILGVAGTTLLRSAAWSRSGWPNLHGQVLHPRQDGSLLLTVYGLSRRFVPDAQVLDGLFFAARREVLEKVRFDDATFDNWHFYDADFTFSAFTAGFRLGIRTDLLVAHYSDGSFDQVWEHYARRFLEKHAQALAGADGGTKPQMLAFADLRSREEWVATTEQIFAEARENQGRDAL